MKTQKRLPLVLTFIALLVFSLTSRAALFDYSSSVGSGIYFDGLGNFTLNPTVNNFKITSGSAAGLFGEMTGTFAIGTITTADGASTAPVSGTGTLVIHDGVNDFTATLVWLDITQIGVGDFLNTSGTVNLTSIVYGGSNPDLVALKAAGSAINDFSFQFVPSVALSDLKTSAYATSFSGTMSAGPPTCNCTLTFSPLSSSPICAGDPIPDVTATEVCGGGSPTTVTVTVTGSATSGGCPQIITRTNTATDDCGTVHTFVQTITVNCLPICKITTSVATAMVGGSNYTASVADAGAGATYVWTILNGTITAGSNTTTITWAAGTDTGSPISIGVTVTTVTGCSSTCGASVKLTPTPPQISLGAGDTATMGFWHNKNGQALILSAPNSPSLGNWLASNFNCIFGNLAGKPNSTVAALFLTDFNVKGQKTYAQIFIGALATYFTSSTLAGTGAAQYGFNVTPGGTGAKTFNVGSLGTTIGLQNNTSYTVLEILQAANANCPFNSAVFNALNTIFDGINTTGDIK
jgi:hypothetical protein